VGESGCKVEGKIRFESQEAEIKRFVYFKEYRVLNKKAALTQQTKVSA